jgi:hypothetical protein
MQCVVSGSFCLSLVIASSQSLAETPSPESDEEEAAPAQLEPPPPCVVKTVRNGWASIACPGPVEVGAKFSVRSQRRIRLTDPISGLETWVPSNKITGGFRVERVRGSGGAGPVPRGTIVEVGDIVELSDHPVTDNLIGPRQWPGLTRLAIELSPFVPIGQLGIGVIAGVNIEHRFHIPLVLGLKTSPVVMTLVRDGAGVNGQVLGKVGFSSDYFEIALEPGFQFDLHEPVRFAFGYSLRFGALDGLSLRFSNSYVITGPAGEEKFEFANAYAEAQVPVHRRVSLLFGGGGQLENSFWARGYIGTRVFLRGSGGPGTVLFSAALGGVVSTVMQVPANSPPGTPAQEASTAGPMLTAAVETRF